MEIPVYYGPGGHRDATTITSGAAVVIDLAAYTNRYVSVTFNQAAYFSQIPSTGTFTFSTSGATTAAAEPTSGAIVPQPQAASTAVQMYVSPKYPRLLVQAQASSITATVIKVSSDKQKC